MKTRTKARTEGATAMTRALMARWPVLGALGLVALFIVVMLGADVLVARRVAFRTAQIVDNAQRSILLVDDVRNQAQRLSAPALSPAEVSTIRETIAMDARAYDPLATSSGEREEWNRLQATLARLQVSVEAKLPLGAVTREIERSIERLVSINREAAYAEQDAIRGIHRQAILADLLVGSFAIGLAALVAVALFRVLGRQRLLVAQYLQLVGEKNQELDAFAGRAAHDLLSPLNPIRGYADLMFLGHESPEQVREMAARIRIAVERMSRVVHDMLELSRAGRPTPGESRLSEVGPRVLEELGPSLRDAEVTVGWTDEVVACSAGVLEQILRNLVENAIKFRSRERPLRLTVKSESQETTCALVVEDNGVGMNADSAQHAFEAYYRGQTEQEVPGHGLGLAIVERATRAVGGTCTLTSHPDAGTRIVVQLPRSHDN